MDTVNYVNKVGKLVNDSTKYNVKLDRVSIENLVLISHFDELVKQVNADKKLTSEILSFFSLLIVSIFNKSIVIITARNIEKLV